uniref:Uncharacterized protein n=1 Tax=Lactuca sativa TaxID=4236 RepID=A0A9R1VC58_LACSA|nr:hypothetical protein LSAT_V11C600306350 [Lactuca sativa]
MILVFVAALWLQFYMECGKEVQLKVVLGIHVFFPNLRLDSTGIKPISRPCSFVPLNFNGFQKKNISITKNRRWLKVMEFVSHVNSRLKQQQISRFSFGSVNEVVASAAIEIT